MADKKKIMLIIGMIAVPVILFFMTWARKRHYPMSEIIKTYTHVLMIAIVIILVAVGLYFLFKKKRSDMVAENKNKILKACKQCRPEQEQELHFMGDSAEEVESKFVGYVHGFCQIMSEPIVKMEKGKARRLKKSQSLTFIAYKRFKGMIGWLFEGYKIVCLLKDDHTSLNGDRIYMRGGLFTPQMFGFFYLSKHHKDTWMIDESVKKAVDRCLLEELMVQSLEIFDDAVSIKDKYRKERETSTAKEVMEMRKEAGKK